MTVAPTVRRSTPEGGDLSERQRARRRAWFLINVLVTVALLPSLFPDRADDEVQVLAGAVRTTVAGEDLSSTPTSTSTTVPAPSTSTTVAPPTSTTAAPRPTTTTTARPAAPKPAPTTTTTSPPPPPAPRAPLEEPAPGATSQSGYATWYEGAAGDDGCAHRSLPFGTVVTVTASSGASVTCIVSDRGPFVAGYVVDLSSVAFEGLAPLSAGRLTVTLTW